MTTVLLSRVAESLFWIGRYEERAEGTARILDVVVHHALEEPTADSGIMADRLVDAMGVTLARQMSLSEVTRYAEFRVTDHMRRRELCSRRGSAPARERFAVAVLPHNFGVRGW